MDRLTLNRRSLAVRLFFSFLSVIVLLSCFNVLLFSFFQRNIKQELIRSNQVILDQAAERYQAHFNRLKTMLFQTYNDPALVKFSSQLLKSENDRSDQNKAANPNGLLPAEADRANYLLVVDIVRRLREAAGNPIYFLDNVMVLYRSNLFMADKEGSSSSSGSDALTVFHPPYSLTYWKEEFERAGNYRLHPVQAYPTDPFYSGTKALLPFSFKLPGSNFELIAMLDAEKLSQSFLGSAPFLIQTEEGTLLYRSPSSSSIGEIPSFAEGETYKRFQDRYFFVRYDSENRLSYITVVPYSAIASQISKLRAVQTFVLLLSAAIALGMSYGYSRRFQLPVKQIIASLQRGESGLPHSLHQIQEFDTISGHIQQLVKERERIHEELRSSKSLLTNYSYIAKLKSLHSGIAEWQDFARAEGPFHLILFQLNGRGPEPLPEEVKRNIGDYIEVVMSETIRSSYTFQIENDRIISVLFEQDQDGLESIRQALHQIKPALNREKETCLVWIATGARYAHTSQLNRAYEEVSDLLQQARPMDETQILTVNSVTKSRRYLAPTDWERDAFEAIQSGNAPESMRRIERLLKDMEQKDATLVQIRRFAEALASRTIPMLESAPGSAGDKSQEEAILRQLKGCCTLEEFQEWFSGWIPVCTAQIQKKKEEKPDIIGFVMKTMEAHYSDDDLTLDQLAGRLSLTSAYLSVYIKEKTGANFSEHLNRIRVRKAKELLGNNPQQSIQSIGEQLGYRNVTSFIRMFKKLTGDTPGEFRRLQTGMK